MRCLTSEQVNIATGLVATCCAAWAFARSHAPRACPGRVPTCASRARPMRPGEGNDVRRSIVHDAGILAERPNKPNGGKLNDYRELAKFVMQMHRPCRARGAVLELGRYITPWPFFTCRRMLGESPRVNPRSVKTRQLNELGYCINARSGPAPERGARSFFSISFSITRSQFSACAARS
jgi:hypothetical protein